MTEKIKETKINTEKVSEEKPSKEKEDNVKKDSNESSVSKPAVKKESKKIIKKEITELEREYVIPLRKEYLKVQKFRKAKKAVKAIKQFLAKHMKVEERDIRKVKVDRYLNEEIWAKGIAKPPTKIKVKAIKKDGIVYAELAEIPEYVKFKMAKDKKIHTAPINEKTIKTAKKTEITPEKEKEKSSVESGMKTQKTAANTAKHTTKAGHAKKTQPQRKVLK